MNIVHLSPASSTEDLRALEEVDDFASTDMGWGGSDRWTYRVLSPEDVMLELKRLSQHSTLDYAHGRVDGVTFQPCQAYEARSQDRYIAQTWDMPGGRWTFTGLFDGHGGHSTVEYVLARLPVDIKTALRSALSSSQEIVPSTISRILSDSIVGIDNAITLNFLRLFPKDKDEFARMTDEEISSIISKPRPGASAPSIDVNALRCLQGSTILVTLIDPRGKNLWVANLGDSRAVLISRTPSGSFRARRVNEIHNGGNSREVRRIVEEHPGERESVVDDRVLGFLAPTRAAGDIWMKLPAVYSRRVLMRTKEFWAAGLNENFIKRVVSPPYVCTTPQVLHHQLRRASDRVSRVRRAGSQVHPRVSGSAQDPHSGVSGSQEEDVAFILCSDGLVDLYEDEDFEEQHMLHRWANVIGEALMHPHAGSNSPNPHLHPHASSHSSLHQAHAYTHSHARTHPGCGHPDRDEPAARSGPCRTHDASVPENVAVRLLRDAIGADDIARSSANLTVEMDERWMDDTTILVLRFS